MPPNKSATVLLAEPIGAKDGQCCKSGKEHGCKNSNLHELVLLFSQG